MYELIGSHFLNIMLCSMSCFCLSSVCLLVFRIWVCLKKNISKFFKGALLLSIRRELKPMGGSMSPLYCIYQLRVLAKSTHINVLHSRKRTSFWGYLVHLQLTNMWCNFWGYLCHSQYLMNHWKNLLYFLHLCRKKVK